MVQVWILFAAWWFKTEWEIAFPFSGMMDGLSVEFPDTALRLLIECPVGSEIEFKPFADRIIQETGMIWPIENQEIAHSILQSAVEHIVILPLVQFGVVSIQYETGKTEYNRERQELVSFQLTPFGLGLLKTLQTTHPDGRSSI